MCQIICGPSDKVKSVLLRTPRLLESLFTRNKDGWGAMYHTTSGVKAIKKLPRSVEDTRKYVSKLPDDGRQVALHWRMRTSGHIDTDNAHPHAVDGGWLIHNGILDVDTSSDESKCDTIHFCRQYLDGNVQAVVGSTKLQQLIADFVGNNRFALLSNDGQMAIINEDQGVRVDGLWFANLYSWDPSILMPEYAPKFRSNYGGFGTSKWPGLRADDDFSWGGYDADRVGPSMLADQVAQAVDEYSTAMLGALLEQDGEAVVEILLEEYAIEENGTYNQAIWTGLSAHMTEAWLASDTRRLVLWARTHPEKLAEALLYNCTVFPLEFA